MTQENAGTQDQRDLSYLSKTLEFTEDDYERIAVRDSLFDKGSDTLEELQKRLKHLYNREVRTNLHAITLSDYLRNKQIPRGLRITKLQPTVGRDNEAFCDKWCQILNKCSFDLMALIIQEATEQLSNIREEITVLQADLTRNMADKAKLTKIENDLLNYKADTEHEIKSVKMRKFKRDLEDYKSQQVYPWRNTLQPGAEGHLPKSNRGRQPRLTPSSSASSMNGESDGSHSSRSGNTTFLGKGRGRRAPGRQRLQSREGSADGVKKDPKRYPTRFNTRNRN